MGFMDKAKKMAEQAQAKLDEAQQQFNERQGPSGGGPAAGGGPAVEYDAHGRPIPASPPPEGVTPAPPAPPTPPSAAPPAPAPPSGGPDTEEDRNRPSYAPPKLSSGDPLSG